MFRCQDLGFINTNSRGFVVICVVFLGIWMLPRSRCHGGAQHLSAQNVCSALWPEHLLSSPVLARGGLFALLLPLVVSFLSG